MKFLKYLALLVFVVVCSCSNGDDSKEQKQQENGTIGITFSDGRSYTLDQVNATFDNNGVSNIPKTLKIVATSSDPANTGTLTIELFDLTSSQDFVNGASVPFQITTANTFGTLNFIDNNSTFLGTTGALTITSINQNISDNLETVDFSATIDTSNGSGLILIGSIIDIVMFCEDGGNCSG